MSEVKNPRRFMRQILALFFLITTCSAQVTQIGQGGAIGQVQIDPAIVTITTLTLPGGTVGTAYSQAVVSVGGSGGYSYTIGPGTLPPGLTLPSGTITGTPTTPGTFVFSLTSTDSAGHVSNPRQLSITVVSGATLTINNTIFPNFPFSQPYGQPINVSGGTGTGYVCSLAAGGTGLPSGITVSGTCATGLTATSVGGTVGNTYTYKLNVVDSGANSFTSAFYTNTVIQPCGPPNYGCALAVVNDNCVLQITGGGASSPCGHPTDASIPNLGNGSLTCAQPCTAQDIQYNNIVMSRCTDAQLNGTITSGSFLNRTYQVGIGSSGDTTAFSQPLTNGWLLAVLDSGNRVYIETINKTTLACYPLVSSGTTPWLTSSGEFGQVSGAAHWFSFFPGTAYTVNQFNLTCTTPGNSGSPCTAPAGSGTVVADFSQAFPGVTSTPWAGSTHYNYGQYVTNYLVNSQTNSITAATCASNVITYTLSPGINTLVAGQLFSVSSLSTYNGSAFAISTVNAPGTVLSTNQTCSNGSVTGASGLFVEGFQLLFQQLTAAGCTSNLTAPFWVTGSLLNTTESGGSTCVWMASGTTQPSIGGGWTSIGGVSVDEKQFSAGVGNNNFDRLAKGALNVSMSGIQNTGFLVYTYDSVADKYYEWNTGSGITKAFSCTGGVPNTGPICLRGSAGISVLGQINVTSTIPCGSTPCQFYIHNVKTQKGGAWNDVTPEFCSSKASGPGNCPSTSKYFWSKGTTTVNMLTNSAAGHETERFTSYSNCANNAGGICQIRYVTSAGVFANNWINSNVAQFDGHFGSPYLNGSTDDTTTTPFAGTTFNNFDFPYHSVMENEVLVVPTCGITSPITTPACSATELQTSQVAREGHTWITAASNQFNPANAIGAFSQDGVLYAVTTDYACQFGATSGGTELCGFPWSASFAYTGTPTIQPTETSSFKPTNAGGFVYQASGSCTSGAIQPVTFNQVIGGTTTDGTCTWTNLGIGNQRADVVLYLLK